MTITGVRTSQLLEATNLLLDARRTATPIADLPEELRPTDQAEAYWVQDRMAEAYEEVGGWKVGAASPEATPAFAPMPKAWIAPSGAELTSLPGGRAWRYRGLEAEVAFLIGEDLPPRQTPYTR
jgi:2-keto-4-pentenoate hydratase